MNDDPTVWAYRYMTARTSYERIKEEALKAYRELQSIESSLIDSMTDKVMPKFELEGIGFSTRKKIDVSVTQANTHLIRDWLMATEGDDHPYVEEKVSKKALLSLLRKKREDWEQTHPDDLTPIEDALDCPDFLNLSTRPGLSVHGWDKS